MIAYSRTPQGRKQRSEAGKKNAPSTILSSQSRIKAWLPEAREARKIAQKATWAAKRERAARAEAMAGLTAFERAMERVRNGAGITETLPIRRAEHPFTLGGVGPW